MLEMSVIITVVVALNELFKRTFGVPARFIPLISLLLGIAGGIFYLEGDLKEKIFYGAIVGLSAAGLFDQSKIVTKKGDE